MLREAFAAAGRDVAELELVGGTRAVFPDDDSPAPTDPMVDQVVAKVADGWTTICIKPSLYLDDVDDFPRWARQVHDRIHDRIHDRVRDAGAATP